MKMLSLYDPAMCCSSGVCGPSVDPVLVRLASDLEWLKTRGVVVERFNLSQQPGAFAAHTTVRETLQRVGVACLPLVFFGDELVASRFYPSREQLAKIYDIVIAETSCDSEKSGCCA